MTRARASRRRAASLPGVRTEPLESRSLLSGTITGLVYDDLNADGGRGPGEPPLAGQTVELSRYAYPAVPPDTRTAVTDADGRYTFADLPDGTYMVHWVPQGDR